MNGRTQVHSCVDTIILGFHRYPIITRTLVAKSDGHRMLWPSLRWFNPPDDDNLSQIGQVVDVDYNQNIVLIRTMSMNVTLEYTDRDNYDPILPTN